jgi:DNA-binding NarL/FixJ family response regulator
VVIVDDHTIVREGLKMILETNTDIRVVGMASDGREAIVLIQDLQPDLIFMDISMPNLNGIEATEIIRKKYNAKVIILSMHQTPEHILRALTAGASGYLLKESAPDEAVQAVRTVLLGHRYLGKGVRPPAKDDSSGNQLDRLSCREREVMQLIVEGKRSHDIGAILGISQKSAETYRMRIMAKLNVSNIPALVILAITNGITFLPPS